MKIDWNILFVFFFYSLRSFTALFWGIFLYCFRRRSPQNLPLSVIFILIGMLYLRNGFVRLPVAEPVDVYNPLSYFILIFIAPFTIFYAWFALGEKHSLRSRLTHFIPFVATGCLWAALELSDTPHIPFCSSLTELLRYAPAYPAYAGFFLLLMLVFTAQVFAYFSTALVSFVRVKKSYRTHHLSVRPLNILIVMDFLFLIYPLTCGVVFLSYNNEPHFATIFNISVAAIITALSVLNFNLLLPLKTDLGFLDNPPQQKAEFESFGQKIKTLIEEKELFSLPQLTLQDIAKQLCSNRSHVSACINSHFGCNFKQLLNTYRIEAAKDLLLHTNLSIQEIVDKTGFNTRGSFYNAFKENVSEELSPTEWRKQQAE